MTVITDSAIAWEIARRLRMIEYLRGQGDDVPLYKMEFLKEIAKCMSPDIILFLKCAVAT